MRWRATALIVVAALGCRGRGTDAGRWPAVTAADLACTTDVDCTTRAHECCTGCAGVPGVVVNTARAARDDKARESICDGVRCPTDNCEPPACWDEQVPFCQAGRCATRTEKRGTCATPTDAARD